MTKVDFKKEFKHLYSPSATRPGLVDVPPLDFLMIDGHGDPNTAPAYREAIEALYAVAYALKFMSKGQLDRDYTVPPLEGLWWAADPAAFTRGDKDTWDWTMMIMQPSWITPDMVQAAIASTAARKPLPALGLLRSQAYHEGLSAQIMHVGPYAAEAPTIARLHAFIQEQGYVLAGKHHEIYIGDPNRTAPEKLKTVVRQPVRPR